MMDVWAKWTTKPLNSLGTYNPLDGVPGGISAPCIASFTFHSTFQDIAPKKHAAGRMGVRGSGSDSGECRRDRTAFKALESFFDLWKSGKLRNENRNRAVKN